MAEDIPRLPRKRFFRQRAHANPFSDHSLDYPDDPQSMDWNAYFGEAPAGDQKVRFVDVGCGYGGLLISLATIFPQKRTLGMEIRTKVSDYVHQRIVALRAQHPGEYNNIGVIRANAMKFLPSFFERGQLEKMFFLFPDPHFKRKKHKARIISHTLLTQYAFLLAIGGLLYVATDVPDLFTWMTSCLDKHPLFQVAKDESSSASDPIIKSILSSTEEGHKVTREGRDKFYAVYRRIAG